MNEESFILTLTSLLELVSSIEKFRGQNCISSLFLPQIENQFESVHFMLFNKSHLITYYDKIESKRFISFECIFKCITPIFSNYTNMWINFKKNFDENYSIQKEAGMSAHFLQPEIQSIVYVSSILILFALIFGLTLICQKKSSKETSPNEILENNLFLPVSNTMDSLDYSNERLKTLKSKSSRWFSRVIRNEENQNNQINEMSFVSDAHLIK